MRSALSSMKIFSFPPVLPIVPFSLHFLIYALITSFPLSFLALEQDEKYDISAEDAHSWRCMYDGYCFFHICSTFYLTISSGHQSEIYRDIG